VPAPAADVDPCECLRVERSAAATPMLVDAADLAGADEFAAGGFDVAEAGAALADFAGVPVEFAGPVPVDLAVHRLRRSSWSR